MSEKIPTKEEQFNNAVISILHHMRQIEQLDLNIKNGGCDDELFDKILSKALDLVKTLEYKVLDK